MLKEPKRIIAEEPASVEYSFSYPIFTFSAEVNSAIFPHLFPAGHLL